MLIGPGSGTKRRGGAGGKREQTWRAGNAALMSTSRWVEGCRNGFRCYGKGDVGHGREHRIIPHQHYRHSGRRRQSIVEDEDPDLPIHLAESRSQVITVSLAGLESTAVLYLTAILPSRSVIPPPPTHTLMRTYLRGNDWLRALLTQPNQPRTVRTAFTNKHVRSCQNTVLAAAHTERGGRGLGMHLA